MWQWQVQVRLQIIFHAEFESVFNMKFLYYTQAIGHTWLSDLDVDFHFQPADRHRHVNTWANFV